MPLFHLLLNKKCCDIFENAAFYFASLLVIIGYCCDCVLFCGSGSCKKLCDGVWDKIGEKDIRATLDSAQF